MGKVKSLPTVDLKSTVAQLEARGMTLSEIATAIGVHRRTLHRWLIGTSTPGSAGYLHALQKLLSG